MRWEEGVWAFALVVLLVNDHLLKGSAWLPGAITGKLSDFAGLVVAPVLLAILVVLAGGRGRRARFVCFAAVAGVFAAIKVSIEAAQGFERALSFVGVRWRLWSDPTDLVAFAVLPFAWRISASLEARLADDAPRLRHVLGAMLGGVACLATSTEAASGYLTSAYLVSVARDNVNVRVSRVSATLDCAALDASVEALVASDFEPAFCAELVPGDVLPLDRYFVYGQNDLERSEEEPDCDAVLLGTRGLAPTIVYWQKGKDKTPKSAGESASVDHELDPSAVYLEPAGRNLYLAGSSAMHVRTIEGPVPELECGALEKPEGIF
ncbi:MAG TPA: hypothetical protein VF103_00815 [Polyangiaceae bacterium]